MKSNSIDKKKIESLLPHREPMLLIDRLINIVHLKSATAIVNVKKTSFFVQGHFPGQPVMPGVFIVEAFGQAAAALTAYGIDSKEYENKLVYLMSVDKARFRNPVIPDCELNLDIEAVRSHGRVWKYKWVAKVNVKKMASLKNLLNTPINKVTFNLSNSDNFEYLSKKLGKNDGDTEVLIELIETFGLKESLKIIEGMYAFSLWDNK